MQGGRKYTYWELEPPKPKQLTEIRRRPAVGHGVHVVGNCERLVSSTVIVGMGSCLYANSETYLQIVEFGLDLRVQLLEQSIGWNLAPF